MVCGCGPMIILAVNLAIFCCMYCEGVIGGVASGLPLSKITSLLWFLGVVPMKT